MDGPDSCALELPSIRSWSYQPRIDSHRTLTALREQLLPHKNAFALAPDLLYARVMEKEGVGGLFCWLLNAGATAMSLSVNASSELTH